MAFCPKLPKVQTFAGPRNQFMKVMLDVLMDSLKGNQIGSSFPAEHQKVSSSPSSALVITLFFREGSPAKIDHRRKDGYQLLLTSNYWRTSVSALESLAFPGDSRRSLSRPSSCPSLTIDSRHRLRAQPPPCRFLFFLAW